MNQHRQSTSLAYPWYDSLWLSAYVRAKDIIRKVRPGALRDFEATMEVLNAPADYKTQHFKGVLDDLTLRKIQRLISDLQRDKMDTRDLLRLGRLVAHDLRELTQIHNDLNDWVSERVNEEVRPSYNFLSLYNNLGKCNVHMDSPLSKWTLDLCIAQSELWPIYLSQCVPWPEQFKRTEDDWHQQIVDDPELAFDRFTFLENEALLFAASNQWHYRDRISRAQSSNYCHLLFLQYVPVGVEDILQPDRWRDYFGIPELSSLSYPSLTFVDPS